MAACSPFAERNLLEQSQQMRLAFQQQGCRRLLRHIEIALGASQAMLALIKEVVGAIAVAEIIELARFSSGEKSEPGAR